MNIDCSVATEQLRIDTTRHRRLSVMVTPGAGNPSSAVVEAKRAFGPSSADPAVSFDTAQTLDLSGATILDIDVTDAPYVSFAVTTAQSGVSVGVDYRLSDQIDGVSARTRVELSDAIRTAQIGIGGNRGRVFLLASPVGSVGSAAVSVLRELGDSGYTAPTVPATTLTLDGATVTEVNAGGADALAMSVTTVESGAAADLYWYQREEVQSDRTGNAFVAKITSNTGTINTTASDIPWSTTELSQGLSYSRSGAVVTFEEPGTYAIHCDVSIVVTAASNRAHYEITTLIDEGSGYTSVNGPRCTIYARLNDNGKYYSGTINWIHVAGAGDNLKFQAVSYGELRDGEYEGGACALSIVKVG